MVNYSSCSWKDIDPCELTDYSVIIPSVAVGNVGQLSCDLLISSLHMNKIASLYSVAFIPILGYDPYDLNSDTLSRSCEVYASKEKKIAVIQLRAPLVHKYAKRFLQEIVDILKNKNVKEIIILTSSFAHEQKHVMMSPFRYVVDKLCSYEEKLKTLKWIEHEHAEGENLTIFGGGFASLLFEICNENTLPCLIVYKYCSEGDNIADAMNMILHLNNVMPLFSDEKDVSSQIVQPASWKLLFGKPPPSEIY